MWCLERDNLSIDLQPVEIPVEEWLNFNLQPRPYRAVEVEESFNPAGGSGNSPLMARSREQAPRRSRHCPCGSSTFGLAIAEYMPWEATTTRNKLRKLPLLADLEI
jgi:hypothetical protein